MPDFRRHSRTDNNRSLILIAFFGWLAVGLGVGLLGIAWPSMRDGYGVSLDAVGTLLLVAALGYLGASFYSGRLIQIVGAGKALAAGHLALALGLAGYALSPSWPWLIISVALRGVGAGMIEAGLNGYVAAHTNARIMNWLHGGFAVGATVSPLGMTALLARGAGWQIGFLLAALLPMLLVPLYLLTMHQWDAGDVQEEQRGASTPLLQTLRLPTIGLILLLFAIYTGLESTVGQWSFTLFTEERGISVEWAGLAVSAYWGSLMAGRFLMGWLVAYTGVDRLMRMSMAVAIVGALMLFISGDVLINLLGMVVIGLSIAPIFPSLMAATPERVSAPHLANAVGFQVSVAEIGIGAIPALAGFLAEQIHLEVIAVMVVVLCLLLFSLHELLTHRSRLQPVPIASR